MGSKPPKSPAPSTTSSEPLEYTYLTDRDCAGDFHAALIRGGLSVRHHDEFFTPNVPVEDQEWIALCAQRGWIGVTNDARIRHDPLSTMAVMNGRCRLFVTVGRATHLERGENFVASLSQIERFLDENPEPFIARVYLRREGVKPWLSYSQWLEGQRRRSR